MQPETKFHQNDKHFSVAAGLQWYVTRYHLGVPAIWIGRSLVIQTFDSPGGFVSVSTRYLMSWFLCTIPVVSFSGAWSRRTMWSCHHLCWTHQMQLSSHGEFYIPPVSFGDDAWHSPRMISFAGVFDQYLLHVSAWEHPVALGCLVGPVKGTRY